MEFDDLLEKLLNPIEGEDQPPNIYDDLRTAHTSRVGAGDAKVEQLTAELAVSQAEVAALKAHNYDLLMQVPKTDAPAPDDSEDSDESEDDVPDAESLFFEEKV